MVTDLAGTLELHVRPPTVRSEQDDGEFLRGWPFHARRSHGHAWHGETGGLGPLLKQLPDRGCRDMPFDDVAPDLGGVAGG